MGTNQVRKLDLQHGVFSQESLYAEFCVGRHFVMIKNPPV